MNQKKKKLLHVGMHVQLNFERRTLRATAFGVDFEELHTLNRR